MNVKVSSQNFIIRMLAISARFRDLILLGLAIKCLRRYNWPPNQYFEMRLSGESGYISACQALDGKQLSKENQLRKNALLLFEKMKNAITESISMECFDLFVYSFDRTAFSIGKTVIYRMHIEKGQPVEFEQVPLYSDDRMFAKSDHLQLEKLKSFPLQKTQFFIPWYLKNDKRKYKDEKLNTLCLVNLTDKLVVKATKKQSRQVFNELTAYLFPDGPFKRVIIKYQCSLNQKITKYHSFRVKRA